MPEGRRWITFFEAHITRSASIVACAIGTSLRAASNSLAALPSIVNWAITAAEQSLVTATTLSAAVTRGGSAAIGLEIG